MTDNWTVDGGPTLGQVLHGARLGWGWCGEVQAFVRIEDLTDDSFLVDVRRGDQLPKLTDGSMFRVWWEGERAPQAVGKAVRAAIAGGLRVVSLRRSRRFVLGWNGQAIGHGP